MLPCALVTPVPAKLTPTPVTLFVPNANTPLVMIDNLPPAVTASVRVNPPRSFNVNASPLLNAPSLVILFLPPSRTLEPVLPFNVPAVIMPVCVTAPDKLLPPVLPSTTVPVTPVVILPSDTAAALIICTAVLLLLVVVNAPFRLISPSLPSTNILPAPASTVLPCALVTPVPIKLTPTPVTLCVPNANMPLVVIDNWPPAVTASVRVNPPKSFNVNAPPLLNGPSLVISFLPPSRTLEPVLPLNVPAVIMPVCVTAPDKLLPPVLPSTTVPVTPVVILPSDTAAALIICTAVLLLLVVVNAPFRLISPSLPSTNILPAPASTVLPCALVTPVPIKLTPTPVTLCVPNANMPLVVIDNWPPAVTASVRVNPPKSFNVNAPPLLNAPSLVMVLLS